jgi:large repetitive protein
LREDLTYDESGALSSLVYSGDVATEGGTVTGEWLAYSRTYDAAGRVATEVTPDGVTDAGFSKSYGYDRAGRLTSVLSAIDTTGGPGCNSRSYVFDKQGNRTSVTDAPATGACSSSGGTSTTWAYDVFSRQLTGANGSGTYVYDVFGRQTTLPSTDAPNPAGGDITIGYYDTDAVASMSQGGTTQSFTLDPAGRRVEQQTTAGLTKTVNSHYGNSSDNPTWATQTDGSNTVTTRYLGALAGGLSATSTTQGSTTTNSLTLVDPGGNIVATVDIPATGNADSITGYATSDEYGADASYVDTGVLQYGWLGGEQRAVSGFGLTVMGARIYNASTGRFTSQDSLRGGNENSYGYPADPINKVDLTGTKAIPSSAVAKIKKWTNRIKGGIRVTRHYIYISDYALDGIIAICGLLLGLLVFAVAIAGLLAALPGGQPVSALFLAVMGVIGAAIGLLMAALMVVRWANQYNNIKLRLPW